MFPLLILNEAKTLKKKFLILNNSTDNGHIAKLTLMCPIIEIIVFDLGAMPMNKLRGNFDSPSSLGRIRLIRDLNEPLNQYLLIFPISLCLVSLHKF